MFLVWNEKDSPPPTQEELDIAGGKKDMTPLVARKFEDRVNKIQSSIADAFQKQEVAKRASFCVLFIIYLIPSIVTGAMGSKPV
jgi:hypothetical protein